MRNYIISSIEKLTNLVNLGPLALYLLLITFSGGFVFLRFFRTKNMFLSLGGSMICGVLAYLLYLSFVSYVLKGGFGIFISFWGFSLPLTFLFIKKTVRNLRFERVNLFVFLAVVLYVALFFLYATTSSVGADTDIYWGIATSFAKGNYPTVLPWQPDFLTVYHHGTFMVEGALHALSSEAIRNVHFAFSFYLVSAIFLFITGMVYEKYKSLFSLIPGIFAVVLFGGPVVITQGLTNFLSQLVARTSSLPEFVLRLSENPGYSLFKMSNGAGAIGLDDLMFTNFYTFGLAAFLLFVYAVYKKISNLLLVVLMVLTLSIDETFFLVEIVVFASLFLYRLIRERERGWLKEVLASCFLFALLFFVVQNPIRDSILTPSPEPRFKFLVETNLPVLRSLGYQPGEHIFWNDVDTGVTTEGARGARIAYSSTLFNEVKSIKWVLPDFRIVAVVVVILSLVLGSRLLFFVTSSALLAYLLSLVMVNTYWPPNGFRFSNQAYNLAFLALGVIVVLLIHRKSVLAKLAAVLVIFVVLPQFIVANAKLINGAAYMPHTNLVLPKTDPLLKAISDTIPPLSRAIYVDNFPSDAVSTYYNTGSTVGYGVFVPFSPEKYKVIAIEPSIDWYDAVNSLSPPAIKKLKVEYVYVKESAKHRLSKTKRDYLKNSKYFEMIRDFGDGILYKVNEAYGLLPETETTLSSMVEAIPVGSKVYLDKLFLNEQRRSLILALSDRVEAMGPAHSHGGDFFMYIETTPKFKAVDPALSRDLSDSIDYAILRAETEPGSLFDDDFEKLAGIEYVSLWKKVK